jgi:site-specific recombinase XerD
MREFIPPFEICSTDDIIIAIGRYRDTTKHKGSTQGTTLIAFKQFLTWLIEEEYNPNIKISKIAKIKTNIPVDLKTEQDILNGDELKAIYQAARNLKDRAFFEVLYESGGRINEICLLKWSQITFKGNQTTIRVKSKTDKERQIPLYAASTVLKNWMRQYPQGAEPDAYVFFGRVSDRFKAMSYSTALRIVKDAAKDAKIEKNVHPHIFRHTRVTDLMRMKFSDSTIKMIMWGHITTDMLKIYAHLTPTDAVNDMNAMFGIGANDEISRVPDIISPEICPKCFVILSKDHKFCSMCGAAMNDEVEAKFGFSYT